jgi:hypothetical protein
MDSTTIEDAAWRGKLAEAVLGVRLYYRTASAEMGVMSKILNTILLYAKKKEGLARH